MKNYYNILGVKSDATADEIKRAYRKLASQHHPDRGGDTAKFQEVEEAYRILSDLQQRQQYDNPGSFGGFRPGPGGFGPQSPFDFETIFDIFGTRFGQGQRPRMTRMSLWVSLRDVAQGGKRTISVATNNGTHAIEIEIPQGINDGDSIQYPELSPDGTDLVISFRVHPDPSWHRQGLTLATDHTVVVWDLILGGESVIRDILGNNLSFVIPPNTQPNTVLRLKGRGLRHRSGAQGDLMIRLQARLPNSISPELRQAIEQNRSI